MSDSEYIHCCSQFKRDVMFCLCFSLIVATQNQTEAGDERRHQWTSVTSACAYVTKCADKQKRRRRKVHLRQALADVTTQQEAAVTSRDVAASLARSTRTGAGECGWRSNEGGLHGCAMEERRVWGRVGSV